VVFCLFRDFSKAAQFNRDISVLSPSAFAWGNKTNLSASEIDPSSTGCGIEIRWIIKARIGKIGIIFERAAREIYLAIEASVLEKNR